MEDILLSVQQYRALLKRLDEITGNLITIKQRTHIEDGYIDNNDLLKLFQISGRTAQRWRKSGSLPYTRFGKKLYYKADIILERIKVCPEEPEKQTPQTPQNHELNLTGDEMACKRCPLFILLNE